MIRIGYCGKKEVEEEHLYGTGLVWALGVTHDVSDEVAIKLLQHPDVYYKVCHIEDLGLAAAKAKPEDDKTFAPMPPLDTMSKKDLVALALREFGRGLDISRPRKDLVEELRILAEGRNFEEGVSKLEGA